MQVIQALQDLPQDGGNVGLLQGARLQLQTRGQQGLRPPHEAKRPLPTTSDPALTLSTPASAPGAPFNSELLLKKLLPLLKKLNPQNLLF